MKEFLLKEYNKQIDFTQYKPLTRKTAILAKCKECCAYSSMEAHRCTITTCPLNQFINKNGYKQNT